MATVLTRRSALTALRNNPELVLKAGVLKRNPCPFEVPLNRDARKISEKYSTPLPVEVLVSEPEQRRARRLCVSYACMRELPLGSFIKLSGEVYTCSPEYLLVALTPVLSDAEIILLGFELCGSYSTDPRHHRGFTNHQPFTNVGKCQRFLKRAEHLRGAKRVQKLLSFVENGAASPREAKLAALLTLPHSKGGYGLPKPLLNQEISWHDNTGRQIKRRVDFYWPNQHLALEYDSNMEHTGAQRIAKDSARRNSLSARGLTMLTATQGQIATKEGTDELARAIARHLSFRNRNRVSNWATRNRKLRKELRLD